MIQRKEKVCGCGCGRKGIIFSKGMLLPCWKKNQPKKPTQRKPIPKITEKKRKQKILEREETRKLHEWFLKIWDKTEDARGYCYCYETGTAMHRSVYRTNTCCYHHPLEKGIEKYKKYSMEEWNILIVLPDIHTQAHSNLDKTPRIKIYTLELKEKY